MAGSTEEKREDIFNCSICLERYRRPKHLPCLHTFCEECLLDYLSNLPSTEPQRSSFPCPVCREDTKSPSDELSVEKWAYAFPVNHLMLSFMDLSTEERNVDEYKCTPCQENNKDEEATHWCGNCSEYFCSDCLQVHRTMKLTKAHKVREVSDLNPTKAMSPKCSNHDQSECSFFCVDHRCLCCATCVAIDHRKCDKVEKVSTLIQEDNIPQKLSSCMDQLKNADENLTVATETKEVEMLKCESQYEQLLGSLNASVKSIIGHFNEVESRRSGEIASKKKRQQESMDKDMAVLLKAKSKLSDMQKILKDAQMSGSQHKIVLTYYNKCDAVLALHQEVGELKSQESKHRQDEKPDKTLVENVSKLEDFSSMLTSADIDSNIEYELVTSSPSSGDEQTKSRNFSFELESAVEIKLRKEDGAMVTGVGAIGGKIIALDKSNQTIKVFRADGRFQLKQDIRSTPERLLVQNDLVVVTCSLRNRSELLFYQFDRSFKFCTSLKLPKGALSVASLQHGIAVLYNTHLLYVEEGVIRPFLEKDSSGFSLFKKACFLCNNQRNDKLFVTDVDAISVSAFMIDEGDVVKCDPYFVYRHEMLHDIMEIAVDSEDFLYVSSMGNLTIHEVNPSGQHIRIVISNTAVIAMYFDYTEEKLYVSRVRENNQKGDCSTDVAIFRKKNKE